MSQLGNKHWLVRFAVITAVSSLVVSCATTDTSGTIGSLDTVKIEIKDEVIEGSLDKAMESYKRFLEETPETAMTPEAIRRLADLKIEKEYSEPTGVVEIRKPGADAETTGPSEPVAPGLVAPPVAGDAQTPDVSSPILAKDKDEESAVKSETSPIADISESEKDFSKRATRTEPLPEDDKKVVAPTAEAAEDLQTANAKEAIQLYLGLLEKYPLYERNDQVHYQLSRAYEETGQVEKAMDVLATMVSKYPNSRHIDEAYFRRAEYFFTRRKYLDAEESYQKVIDIGQGSQFYELSLYKQGWAFFKQELYEEALNDYIKMLDYKASIGYDFEQVENKIEKKRMDDTFRVISLSFSYLGGAPAVVEFFEKNGPRFYEPSVYSHLGEYYLDKRRYNDAALAYNTFVDRNPIHKVAPFFHIRVVEIYTKGGFAKLVIESKKTFAKTYGLRAPYWGYFDINKYPAVLAYLKTNLVDLAQHYHALYQDKRLQKFKQENYEEAKVWYAQYLESFPEEALAPEMNYKLASLMLENKDYRDAALEYERTAYSYQPHEKASEAGYAAVYAYREFLKVVAQSQRVIVKREIIKSSLRFADAFPTHKEVVVVLTAALNDLFGLKDYPQSIKVGRKIINEYPDAKVSQRRAAWLIVGHSTFALASYAEAEEAYTQALALMDKNDKSRDDLIENLAASIYKQGEQARKLEKHREAADHFLRVATVTPTSKIRSTAEYDAAASLILLKDWAASAAVLVDFRKRYPKHELQADVTKKLAVIYKEDGKLLLAAAEFERIETETRDEALRREALMQAAELYEEAKDRDRALVVYERFVKYFPRPVEEALESRSKIAEIYKEKGETTKYIAQLKAIVDADANAGAERTDRTRFLAANAALVLVEPSIEAYSEVKLVKPFKKNLNKKKDRMKTAVNKLTALIDYQVGDVTAAATYHMAEIYLQFSKALMTSERPDNLSAEELEQYELVIEEQAYPFEEKGINVHEKNLELLSVGVYNEWIDKSIAKLSELLPARYAKPELATEYVAYMVKDVSNKAAKAAAGTPVTEQPAPAQTVAPVEQSPVPEETTQTEQVAPVTEAPVVGATPAKAVPAAEAVPADTGTPVTDTEEVPVVEEAAPVEAAQPAEAVPEAETAPAAEAVPADTGTPVTEEAPAVPEAETVPQAEEVPAVTETPVAEEAPIVEETAPAEALPTEAVPPVEDVVPVEEAPATEAAQPATDVEPAPAEDNNAEQISPAEETAPEAEAAPRVDEAAPVEELPEETPPPVEETPATEPTSGNILLKDAIRYAKLTANIGMDEWL